MSTEDMNAWAKLLREKYGIAQPLAQDDDHDEEDVE